MDLIHHGNGGQSSIQDSQEHLNGLARIYWRGFHSVMAISASNDVGDLYPRAERRRRGL